jgi:hypothetical protein
VPVRLLLVYNRRNASKTPSMTRESQKKSRERDSWQLNGRFFSSMMRLGTYIILYYPIQTHIYLQPTMDNIQHRYHPYHTHHITSHHITQGMYTPIYNRYIHASIWSHKKSSIHPSTTPRAFFLSFTHPLGRSVERSRQCAPPDRSNSPAFAAIMKFGQLYAENAQSATTSERAQVRALCVCACVRARV